MQLCERCGVEIAEDAAYCRQCGRRTLTSWASTQTPAAPAPTGSRSGNPLSTLAVFFGVVAVLNVIVGAVAVVLAGLARFRDEPSSRFAVAVAGCGAVIGLVVRLFVLDSP